MTAEVLQRSYHQEKKKRGSPNSEGTERIPPNIKKKKNWDYGSQTYDILGCT